MAPFVEQRGAAAEIADREIEDPSDGLRRPGGDAVGNVKEQFLACAHGPPPAADDAAVRSEDSGETFEQRGFAGSVRTDQSKDLALAEVEADIRQRADPGELFGQTGDLEKHGDYSG